jgi:predicted NodU family carbamoyl transferase
MGLAPYGEPVYADLIKKHLIDIKPDGSYRMAMEYFNYCDGLTMTGEVRRALRRPRAQARGRHQQARDGSRRLDPGRDRGGDAQDRAAHPQDDEG